VTIASVRMRFPRVAHASSRPASLPDHAPLVLRHKPSLRQECSPPRTPGLPGRHLRHLLKSYQEYYNEARTHLSLQKDAPVSRAVQAVGQTFAVRILGGLHHRYIRA
jgi:hypothetical protein